MITLIMLGLLASSLPVVSSWFWGLYIASWIVWGLKFIIEIILIGYKIKVEFNVDK